MKTYLAILKCRFAALFQYRAAALAGLSTQVFWGLIKTMIFTAFFAQSMSPQPITLEQAITFIWLGQALLQLIPWNIDREIEEQIRTGNVAYELVRPVDLYLLWYFRAIAMRIVPTFLRCVPIFVLAGLFFGLQAPVSIEAALAFAASLFMSVLLSSAIITLVVISFFWTISGEGILRLLPHTTIILTGMMVPLPLFPEWMQNFLSVQPFRGIVDIPSRLYTGVIPVSESLYYLGFQLAWTLILVGFGRYLMKVATKRLVIQGG